MPSNQKTYESAKERIQKMNFSQEEIDFIFSDWEDVDHFDWVSTASESEIRSWVDAWRKNVE